MSRFLRSVVVLVVGVLSFSMVAADVTLPALICDHMVIQRDQPVCVWGWASPSEQVTVRFGESSASTTTDSNGDWLVKLPAVSLGGPDSMTVTGKNTIIINDILIGDVWVCSGQSNMQLTVKVCNNAEQEIAQANYPNIRLFLVQLMTASEPQSDCFGAWTLCSPDTIANFTAVGYYFGRELNQQLEIPIGLIGTSWGGTPCEAWTQESVLESDPQLNVLAQRGEYNMCQQFREKRILQDKLSEWKKRKQQADAEKKTIGPAPRQPWQTAPQSQAGQLFNGMIAPLLHYPIKGAIWYQGESNASRAYQYRSLFATMINSWRKDWQLADFPFLFVQLASLVRHNPGDSSIIPEKGDPKNDAWAELREAQTMTLALPNTGMAVTIDIGCANDIHPRNKQDVGKRLALWALANTYGKKDIVYSGPLYTSMNIEGDSIRIHFDHVGSGLMTKAVNTAPADVLKGFAIAGDDKKFVWADAKIDGDTVVVRSDQVPHPVAVRYGWAIYPICNLFNKEGLPASPFRTDDWPGITVNNK